MPVTEDILHNSIYMKCREQAKPERKKQTGED